MPMVDLVIADNSLYPEKGRMSIIDGQFDKSTGAISIRAIFPNANGTLRNGNTGKGNYASAVEQCIGNSTGVNL